MKMWIIITIALAPMVAYWVLTIRVASLLPKQRRRVGDSRNVPELFNPMTSHLWTGIILTEKTSEFSPATKLAFRMARISLGLMPVGFILAMVLMNTELRARSESGTVIGPPPVTLEIENDR